MRYNYRNRHNSPPNPLMRRIRMVSRRGGTHRREEKTTAIEGRDPAGFTKVWYKDSVNSYFFIEEVIEREMGYFNTVESVSIYKFAIHSFLEEINSVCKVYKHKHDDSVEIKIREALCVNSDYCVRLVEEYGTYLIFMFFKEEKSKLFLESLIEKYTLLKSPERTLNRMNIMMGGDEIRLKPVPQIYSLELNNYNDDFSGANSKIVDALKQHKGIVLLHGEPGTGKTSYIRCLPNMGLDKEFIFVPPSFGGHISSPKFLEFMSEHKNSILVIEDAESILRTRTGGGNHAVSNILNLTDGIIADLLRVQVICTLNCDIHQIDDAVRRRGRMIYEYKFDKLSVDLANKRLEELYPGEGIITKVPLTIADIYNKKEDVGSIEVKRAAVGFSRH